MINYSIYREKDRQRNGVINGRVDIESPLEIGFPTQIRYDSYLRLLLGKEVLILDDNTTTGKTLMGLKDILVENGISDKVDIGAVELGRLDKKGRFNQALLNILKFEPVGDRMSEFKKQRIILESIQQNRKI